MLSFANANGNLFNRLGTLGALVANVRTHQLAQLPAMTNTITGVVAQYNSESDLQALIGDSYISTLSAVEGVCSTAQTLAQQTLNRMVFRDNPQISQSLTTLNVLTSIQELIRQMNGQGATVLRMSIGATPAAFIGNGNGCLVASTVRPLDGLPLENSLAETITVKCVNDSFVGGATKFNEGFTAFGTGNQPDVFAFNWPLGSNCAPSLNACDGDTSQGSGNFLTNSNWATWTGGVPNNWTLNNGTAGSDFQQNTSIVFGSGSSLQFLATAAQTNVRFLQQFTNGSTGTGTSLSPQTQYASNLWLRRGGTAVSAGRLTVDLVDQNFNTILDAAGNANSYVVDLTQLTTAFANYGGAFRLPLILPSQIYIRYSLSQPLSNNGCTVYLAKTALSQMTQLYTSGPFLSVFSGSIPFVQYQNNPYLIGDYATLAVTNSRGAGGTLSTFQTLFSQLFSPIVVSNEFLLPSSLTPTISDSLI